MCGPCLATFCSCQKFCLSSQYELKGCILELYHYVLDETHDIERGKINIILDQTFTVVFGGLSAETTHSVIGTATFTSKELGSHDKLLVEMAHIAEDVVQIAEQHNEFLNILLSVQKRISHPPPHPSMIKIMSIGRFLKSTAQFSLNVVYISSCLPKNTLLWTSALLRKGCMTLSSIYYKPNLLRYCGEILHCVPIGGAVFNEDQHMKWKIVKQKFFLC